MEKQKPWILSSVSLPPALSPRLGHLPSVHLRSNPPYLTPSHLDLPAETSSIPVPMQLNVTGEKHAAPLAHTPSNPSPLASGGWLVLGGHLPIFLESVYTSFLLQTPGPCHPCLSADGFTSDFTETPSEEEHTSPPWYLPAACTGSGQAVFLLLCRTIRTSIEPPAAIPQTLLHISCARALP